MLTNKKKTPLKNRKLEITVYVVVALIAAAILIVVVSLVSNGKDIASESVSDATVSAQDDEQSDIASAESEVESEEEKAQVSAEAASKEDAKASSESSTEPVASKSESKPSAPKPSGDYVNYTVTGSAEADQWYLHIASLKSPMPGEWRPTDLTTIDGEGRKVDSRIYEAYSDMVSAAQSEGLSIFPISAYRSYDTQNTLFNNRIQRAKNEHPDYTDEEAYNEAKMNVAPPNTSDHELGLAVDFNSVEEDFEDTSTGKWLAAHCSDYGFVLRYPKDKISVTGVNYEPWHFRFVGVKHAKKMEQLGMCLEEYTEYVRGN